MTDTLPPLPLRKVRHVYNESKGYEVDAWLEDEVRAYAIAYAAAAVAAEREACAALCDAQAASLDNPYNRATGAADDLADSAKDCAAAIRTRKP